MADTDGGRLGQVVASALDAVVTMDVEGTIVGWNPRAEEVFGWRANDVLGLPMDQVILPARYRRAHRAGLARYLRSGETRILNRRVEVEALQRSGREIPVELAVTALPRKGRVEFCAFIRDLSRERATEAALRETEERFRLLVETLPGIVYIDDPGARGIYISPQIQSLLGYSAEEWLLNPDRWVDALHPDDRERAVAELSAGEAGEQRFTSEYRLITRDGGAVWIRDEATPVRDSRGRILIHGVMFDVTREREIEAELAAEVAERAEIATALSSFRPGSDAHATADALLRELLRIRDIDIGVIYAFDGAAATPLAVSAPPGAPVAVGRPLPTHRTAYLQANALRGPWVDEWREAPDADDYVRAWLEVGLRIGAYVPLSSDGAPWGLIAAGTTTEMPGQRLARSLPALLDFATVGNAVLGPQVHARRAESEVRALRELIDTSALRSVFQPIVHLESGEVIGYEALTRFTDGSLPLQRFAEAERAGMAIELEAACMASAIAAARHLPSGPWLSVNLSPIALPGLRQLAAVAAGADRPLVVEITERSAIDDYAAARRLLRRHLPQARVAVDDAGAGFASLRHIAELRPSIVKLDMQLVRNVHRDPAREALVAGMVHFASASGCELVAEGIETEAERRALLRLGVMIGQGFLLGRPDAVVDAA
ncbi:MAG TPA: EAL domain-containing protein [Candidatus Limnocylindria bacterium]|nr:EAL domain-containing protein [Candidatus Limnocylindria bacterium]